MTNDIRKLEQQALAAGIAAGEPMPQVPDRSKGDGVTTSLWHRGHQWTLKYYVPLMPHCTICGGVCDPRLTTHTLCEARVKWNQPTPMLDSTPECPCAVCSKGKERY